MRRYSVRFLVAILTFAIGVTLSLILGLFKPAQVKISPTWERRHDCPNKFRVYRPALLTVDTEMNDPLKLVYLGDTLDGRMRFLVENRRDQPISSYTITGNEIWGTDGREGQTVFVFSSEDVVAPGETSSIIAFPRNPQGVSVRLSRATFQSGFTWINPREAR